MEQPASNPTQVVVITPVHDRKDTRVFLKECKRIAAIPGIKLDVVVADGLGDEPRDGYVIHDCGKPSGGKWKRILSAPFRAFKKARALKPKAVHFHDPELIPIGVLFSLLGVKVIYDVHESVVDDIHDKFWIPGFLKPVIAAGMYVLEKIAGLLFFRIIAATPTIASRKGFGNPRVRCRR